MRRPHPYPDHVKLLHGPYQPPALKKGDRAFCLFRDADVIVTSWTAARLPWPRCRLADGPGGGGGGGAPRGRAAQGGAGEGAGGGEPAGGGPRAALSVSGRPRSRAAPS